MEAVYGLDFLGRTEIFFFKLLYVIYVIRYIRYMYSVHQNGVRFYLNKRKEINVTYYVTTTFLKLSKNRHDTYYVKVVIFSTIANIEALSGKTKERYPLLNFKVLRSGVESGVRSGVE